MRLTKIKLSNFGIHKDLEETLEGSIVGIFGVNGGGKSTIQKGIEYGLTGSINDATGDAICTYLHNYGMEGAATSASVVLEFIVDGSAGSITRSFTASSGKRKLEWDGKTYTKAADVEAMLDTIIGADKKAIAALVCVKQGHLDKLLTGKESERRALLMKLCMLGHMNGVAVVADKQRLVIKGMQTDLAPVMDEAVDMGERCC